MSLTNFNGRIMTGCKNFFSWLPRKEKTEEMTIWRWLNFQMDIYWKKVATVK